MNFLEQLAAEWYAYNGYFVRTNIKYGSRAKGGFVGEIDVAAYMPKNRSLIHIETSTDADTWEERKKRFIKKFATASDHYAEVFDFSIKSIERVAIVGFSRVNSPQLEFGNDIKVISVPEFMKRITEKLSEYTPLQKAVPESYNLLRAIQFTVSYGL